MSNQISYLAAQKLKPGELLALKQIEPRFKSWMTPLFDIVAPTKKDLYSHLRESALALARDWGSDHASIVDTFDLPVNPGTTRHPTEILEDSFRMLRLQPILCTGFNRSVTNSTFSEQDVAIQRCLQRRDVRKLAIRLLIDDLIFLSETTERIERIVNFMGVELGFVTVILDLRSLDSIDDLRRRQVANVIPELVMRGYRDLLPL